MVNRMARWLYLSSVAFILLGPLGGLVGGLGGCASGPGGPDRAGPAMDGRSSGEAARWAGTPLNRVRVIGSHNSYKRAAQRELIDLVERQYAISLDSIDYAHLPLTDQLNLGLRNLELDVYYDPDGGRYADPPAHRLLRAHGIEPRPWDPAGDALTPGFKLIHDADIDFATWHVAFEKALRELNAWSRANPGHLPVLVTMNCKHEEERRFPGATGSVAFDRDALRALNGVIVEELGERLLTPDMVRAGHATLREALTVRGWPTVDAVAGRFYFLLDHGGDLREAYRVAFPGGNGAAMFVSGHEGADDAAVFVRNEPIEDEAEIRGLVARGFIVRTRSDAGTTEAREESFDRFEAAKRSGAQVITTDYYIPDRSVSDRYFVRFNDGTFVRAGTAEERPPESVRPR